MSKTIDHRFLAATIRLARRHEGLTSTNPSVACVIVREDGKGPHIVGHGVTAIGGRPHAEPIALAMAGSLAKGATAYVTLEPCAHHGRTPPCAQTLIDAGIVRVVTAMIDPDERVNNQGHAMLRAAGIEVCSLHEGENIRKNAGDGLRAYLIHKSQKRSQVTLKLAISADGYLGQKGGGQIAITGPLAKAQTHLLRARHQAILIGAGTLCEDDPELTCRLQGLENRSPIRIILDAKHRTPISAKIFQTARSVRTLVVAANDMPQERHLALGKLGVEIFNGELVNGRIALPELLEDLAAIGIMSLLVEGGAAVAEAFLKENLVDEWVLYSSPVTFASKAGNLVRSPILIDQISNPFELCEKLILGEDVMYRYIRS